MLLLGRRDPPAGHVQRRTGQDQTGPDRTRQDWREGDGDKDRNRTIPYDMVISVLTACPLPVARYLLVTGGSTAGPLMVR